MCWKEAFRLGFEILSYIADVSVAACEGCNEDIQQRKEFGADACRTADYTHLQSKLEFCLAQAFDVAACSMCSLKMHDV